MFFIAVQGADCCHFLICKFKAEQVEVFPDMLRIGRAGDHHDPALQIPAEDHLGRGYTVSFCNGSDRFITQKLRRMAPAAQRIPALDYDAFFLNKGDDILLLVIRVDLISMADKIEQEFISLDVISGGELYLGLAESSQIRYLARVIKAFKTRYPNLHYHITSGDTEQIADKLDKGLLDFLVLAELPDSRKYEYLAFPEKDLWGLVIPEGDPLSEKDVIRAEDLAGLSMFCSEQAWNADIKKWAGSSFSRMKLEGSFRLSYNGSVFTREGLGYLLTFRDLIDTSKGSGLVFRPLEPALETTLYITWNRYQTFTPIAERFLQQLKDFFYSGKQI